jgi:sugar phosphate permease
MGNVCPLHSGGLAATALVNLGFGLSSAYPLFILFWGTNGLLQVRTSIVLAGRPHGL